MSLAHNNLLMLNHEHKLETKKTEYENRIVTEIFCSICNMLVINYVQYLTEEDNLMDMMDIMK